MTRLTDSGSYMRRGDDIPVLVVSQDYELFFHRSGSIEKCLLEPCELLLDFANKTDIRITFFVDAGMLCRMQNLAPTNPSIERDLSRVKRHLESVAAKGHEIGLHVHPHWEDTRWQNEAWDFSDSRYRLDEFPDAEIAEIVSRYTAALNELCDGSVTTYRAGGFCIEPFSQVRDALLKEGITVDSSVVPGARLDDDAKGFDFSKVPDVSWWQFSESPRTPSSDGEFLEIPITPQVLPFFHYWGRAVDRVLGRQPAAVLGDGMSKAIGREEIVRRLSGRGRTSELSIDAPKARRLGNSSISRQRRDIWQVMGHPKLLGSPSIASLEAFVDQMSVQRFETLAGLARAIRAGELAIP